jgi:hypothetical protein
MKMKETNKRKDLLPTKTYNNTMQSYGLGTLKNPKNGDVNGEKEAKQLASQKSSQSNNYDRYGVRR